jgi:HEXXH motif-containing protein
VRSRREVATLDPALPLTIGRDGSLSQGGRACETAVAFEPLSPSIALALVDDNPLASYEAHPDKAGSELDLGGAAPGRWVASLRDALARIERYLPLHRQELEVVLSEIVPVGTDDERHLSASYREALGVIYVSLHPDPLTMTEAVVHEAQHNKLNAVLTVDPLLENDPTERYRSPVRPDPRPLLGVLLAVHAFVPVALLYAAMHEAADPLVGSERVRERMRQIVRINQEGLELLEAHARPSSSGRELLGELRALHGQGVRRLAALSGAA